MHAIYHLNIDELTVEFIDILKKQFKDADIDLVVKENNETFYLNHSSKNKQILEESINEVNDNKLIRKSLSDLGLWIFVLWNKAGKTTIIGL